jgi:hypothetical protein
VQVGIVGDMPDIVEALNANAMCHKTAKFRGPLSLRMRSST